MKKMNVGVVGATGLVGEMFLSILDERQIPLDRLVLFASVQSQGKIVSFQDRDIEVETLRPGCFAGLDVVFFSSGDEISKEWAPVAVQEGAYAIDNSAAFRMNPEIPLCVPEVNGHLLKGVKQPSLIANPNCSTIQLVVALKPLVEKFGVDSVRVATYQSVSGAGREGLEDLIKQSKAILEGDEPEASVAFKTQIGFNVIPQIGEFDENGFSSEEMKIVRETKKILELPDLKISAFTVRVPTLNVHSEAVWVTLKKEASLEAVQTALRSQEGIVFQNDTNVLSYTTKAQAAGNDPVYVGRVHKDLEFPNTFLMWVVSDNLRKGAALNGLQIAEKLLST